MIEKVGEKVVSLKIALTTNDITNDAQGGHIEIFSNNHEVPACLRSFH